MPNQAIASLVSAIILGPSWSGPRPRSVKVTKDGIELPRNRERARSQVPYRENLTDAELGRRMRQMTEDGNREGRSRERRNEMNDPRGRGNVLMIGNGRPVIYRGVRRARSADALIQRTAPDLSFDERNCGDRYSRRASPRRIDDSYDEEGYDEDFERVRRDNRPRRNMVDDDDHKMRQNDRQNVRLRGLHPEDALRPRPASLINMRRNNQEDYDRYPDDRPYVQPSQQQRQPQPEMMTRRDEHLIEPGMEHRPWNGSAERRREPSPEYSKRLASRRERRRQVSESDLSYILREREGRSWTDHGGRDDMRERPAVGLPVNGGRGPARY